jgi:hypothetical protein
LFKDIACLTWNSFEVRLSENLHVVKLFIILVRYCVPSEVHAAGFSVMAWPVTNSSSEAVDMKEWTGEQ